jgi:hypothetical protein
MYAIIQNGRVVNIVMADADTATANGWIASTGAKIGDTWDGTGFARPAKYPDLATGKTMRLQDLAARRYEAEEGGTTLGGNPLATDRITQAKITAAYVKASADDGFQITAWKTGPGIFSTLTAATIIAAANAIEAHVQACFANEASLSGEITDAADLVELAAVDIEGGW